MLDNISITPENWFLEIMWKRARFQLHLVNGVILLEIMRGRKHAIKFLNTSITSENGVVLLEIMWPFNRFVETS